MTTPEVGEPPSGYLFGNGNAVFFDEDGEQIPDLQKHGLSGVHEFTEQYPDAEIWWSIWDGQAVPIHDRLLRYIREPSELPNDEGAGTCTNNAATDDEKPEL